MGGMTSTLLTVVHGKDWVDRDASVRLYYRLLGDGPATIVRGGRGAAKVRSGRACGEEEDGFRRPFDGPLSRETADAGGSRVPKVLASVAAMARAVPWTRSQWQTKQ